MMPMGLALSMDVTRFRRFWAIEHHIFSAIWGKEHPQRKGFLAVIELDVPDGSTNNALPPPVPTKDKLFYGDYRLAALYAVQPHSRAGMGLLFFVPGCVVREPPWRCSSHFFR